MAKVALLIGVGNYEHPDALKPLVSAPKDVAAMQRILLNTQMGEFSEVTPLIDPDPMQMQEAIETLYRDRAKDDLVLLFFSGHGIKDDSGKLYFSTRVTRKTPKGELVKSTAVPARFVQEIMGNSRSRRQVMILDCCFSGAFDPALNAKDDGSLDVQGQLGAEGRVVLTSSSSTQYSFEQQGSELSIYTRFLVEGIETGAADQDNDGKVSVRELHEYATKKVQETAPTMNPKIIVLKDEGFDVVFAKAQIADPKLKYRKDAERYSMRGEISPVGRTVLDTQRIRLGLTLEEAQEIENQVLQPFRERLKHLEDYRSAFVAEVARQYPLAPETLSELKDLQEIFGLRKEDVTQVEQEVFSQITSQSEAHLQELGQQRQQEAERLQTERQQEIVTSQPLVPTQASLQPTVQSTKTSSDASVVLARRQFLKWAIPAGVGMVGVTVASQFLGHQSPESSTSSTPSPSTPTVDYSKLEGFLKAGQWKEADQETTHLILKVANAEQESYLDAARIQDFPCEVMSNIDRLWVDNSGGKFGFSVQKKIYIESCGGTADGQYDETYEKAISCFTTSVGWCTEVQCLNYLDLTFNTQAPPGHLPTFVYEKGDTSWVESLSAITANCNL
jgi:GUN4-like/Caspase domain